MFVEYAGRCATLSCHEEGYMKGKRILLAAAIFAAIIFSSCTFEPYVEGDVYLAYYWDAEFPIQKYYDNNRWMPSIIANNTYYEVEPGNYSGYYISYFGIKWRFTYELEANYEVLSSPYDPAPTYFQLWFSEAGPYFMDRTPSRSIEKNSVTPSTDTNKSSIMVTNTEVSKTKIEKTMNGYTMRLEYWKDE